MHKLKTLTLSSVLTVLAASCDAAALDTQGKVQAAATRPATVQSITQSGRCCDGRRELQDAAKAKR